MFSGLEGGVEEEDEEEDVEEGVSDEEETTLDGSGTLLLGALVVATDTWDKKITMNGMNESSVKY